MMEDYAKRFDDYFQQHRKVAVAFSGGVDSSLLLYEAAVCGADVKAYYVKGAFQPQFEVDDAVRVVEYINDVIDSANVGKKIELEFIELDVLSDENVACNSDRRCYYCKKRIMSAIIAAAAADGYEILLDGNNASDETTDRPGMAATAELGVRSPLRELGATKQIVRQLSAYAGLFTASKPAYACLATRIPTGEEITARKLEITELAEAYLFKNGFRDFRVRMRGDAALVQVKSDQYERAASEWAAIRTELLKYYTDAALDTNTR